MEDRSKYALYDNKAFLNSEAAGVYNSCGEMEEIDMR